MGNRSQTAQASGLGFARVLTSMEERARIWGMGMYGTSIVVQEFTCTVRSSLRDQSGNPDQAFAVDAHYRAWAGQEVFDGELSEIVVSEVRGDGIKVRRDEAARKAQAILEALLAITLVALKSKLGSDLRHAGSLLAVMEMMSLIDRHGQCAQRFAACRVEHVLLPALFLSVWIMDG